MWFTLSDEFRIHISKFFRGFARPEIRDSWRREGFLGNKKSNSVQDDVCVFSHSNSTQSTMGLDLKFGNMYCVQVIDKHTIDQFDTHIWDHGGLLNTKCFILKFLDLYRMV